VPPGPGAQNTASDRSHRWEPAVEPLDELPGRRVVVLAPHMDDEVIGCGGTLRRMAQRGADISVVFLTDGRWGDAGLEAMDERSRRARQRELMEVRKAEAHRAAEIIGISTLYFLDGEDSALAATPFVRGQVQSIFGARNPDTVFFPCPGDPHPDHRATARALWEAAQARPWSFTCYAYEVWAPLDPTCIVEITDTFPVKEQALRAYRSQLKDRDFLRVVRGLNAYRSMLLDGRGFAEAFWRGGVSDLAGLFVSASPSGLSLASEQAR